jgi:two-component system sensor histidine kinase HydH
LLVIEYEPLQSRQVRAVGLVAALALLVLTVFFWRALRRHEAADARRQRDRRLAALGEMSAVLAHEIRNPLASLKGHAQLLVELLGGERERQKAERVVQETERLEAISSDLLDFVRSGPLERRDVSPAEIVRGAAGQLGADRFRIDLDRAPALCRVDPLRLQQVLTNVMQNALQASSPEDSVEVTVAEEHGRLSIRVRDRGPGIAPADRERIFEPFHTSRTRGTGLGLAVSRRFVELHGGAINAEDVEDGAELHISIPIKQQGATDA